MNRLFMFDVPCINQIYKFFSRYQEMHLLVFLKKIDYSKCNEIN